MIALVYFKAALLIFRTRSTPEPVMCGFIWSAAHCNFHQDFRRLYNLCHPITHFRGSRLHVITQYLTGTFLCKDNMAKPVTHCCTELVFQKVLHLCFCFQWNQQKVCFSVCTETPRLLLKSGSYALDFMFFLFFFMADPTRIIQGPVDLEIIVGESIVLPCQVASDPVLDVSFSWAFNGQLITKGDGHFELVGGVSDPYSYIEVY